MGDDGIERIAGDGRRRVGVRERASGVLPGTAGRRGQEVHLMTTQIRHIDRSEIRRQLRIRDQRCRSRLRPFECQLRPERFIQSLGCFNHLWWPSPR